MNVNRIGGQFSDFLLQARQPNPGNKFKFNRQTINWDLIFQREAILTFARSQNRFCPATLEENLPISVGGDYRNIMPGLDLLAGEIGFLVAELGLKVVDDMDDFQN